MGALQTKSADERVIFSDTHALGTLAALNLWGATNLVRAAIARRAEVMIEHKNARTLLRYWQRVRRGAQAPQQRTLRPSEMKELLPNIFVLQRFDPHHFVFRLAGTGYCALFGREFRTQNLLALFQGPARKYLSVLLDRVVGLPCVGIGQARAETLSGDHCQLEYLFLPLADSDGRVNRLLGTANVTDWGTASVYDRFARQTLLSLQVLDPAQAGPEPLDPGDADPTETAITHVLKRGK